MCVLADINIKNMHIMADCVTTFMQNMSYIVIEPNVPHSWFNSECRKHLTCILK